MGEVWKDGEIAWRETVERRGVTKEKNYEKVCQGELRKSMKAEILMNYETFT